MTKDLELSNVEMSNFVIIVPTVAMLIVASVNVILTDKAQQQGHEDNDGRVYYIGTFIMGIVYTLGTMMLMVTGTL